MTDQETELAGQLRAADARPRPSWAATLRSDLDAAWEAGELPTTRATVGAPSPRRRPPVWLAVAAAAAAVGIAVGVVLAATDDRADRIEPATPDTTATTATTVPVTSSPVVAPTTTAVCATAIDVSELTLVTHTATDLWRIYPDDCITTDADASIHIESTAIADPTRTSRYDVPLAALRAAGVDISFGPDATPWVALRPIGIVGTRAIFQTAEWIVEIELSTGAIRTVGFETEMSYERVPAFLVGDAVFSLDDGGPARLVRFDFATGTKQAFEFEHESEVQMGGTAWLVVPTVLPVAGEHLWFKAYPQESGDELQPRLYRVDLDGSVRDLTQPGYDYGIPCSSSETAWTVVVDVAPGSGVLTTDATGATVMSGAHGGRIDIDTGELLAAPPNPPGIADGQTGMCGADGMLYWMPRTQQGWWFGNDGSVTALTPLTDTPVGVVGDLVVLMTADRHLTTAPISELLGEIITPAPSNAP